MLSYDSKNKLREYEEIKGIKVCNNCHKLYRQQLCEQIPGLRAKEDDDCPYCGFSNGNSMSVEYANSVISDKELDELKQKSLIKTVLCFCHNEYMAGECDNCNHIDECPGECRGNCKQCLGEIHFPSKYPRGKKDYDCERMLDFYVCDYAAKYTSEMLYLMRKSTLLNQIDDYHVVSIGCGACPDLMAFERYCHEKSPIKSVRYYGIDVNKKWRKIHNVIKNYRTTTLLRTEFAYRDAVSEEYKDISNANVLILQYVISHFYNTGKIKEIDEFFDRLIEKIVQYKEQENPFVIMINDVNSNRRGRDYFQLFLCKLQKKGFDAESKSFYFSYNVQNDHQRYGIKHEKIDIAFNLPSKFDEIYGSWKECSSAQLLIEINKAGIL